MTNQEAINILDNLRQNKGLTGAKYEAYTFAIAALEAQEKAPIIVHCKDCKHRHKGWGCSHEQWESESGYYSTEEDDYCSYGEKLEEQSCTA